MLAAVLVAVLGLGLVVLASRPGDGRAETALALPLVAAAAVLAPAALPAVFGGVALAYCSLVLAQRRTLLFGRRLRALAVAAGATVPLGALAAATVAGATVPLPELWVLGSVAPGALAFDLRRQAAGRRAVVASFGATALVALAALGVLVHVVVAAPRGGWWGLAAPSLSPALWLPALAALLVVALAAGTVARWRYGLHVGPLSIPLVAAWTLEGSAVPLTYLVAGTAAWIAVPRLRRHLPGRRLAAAVGLLGAGVAAAVLAAGTVAGVAGLAALVVGVLAAEDARVLRGHAGRDRSDAVVLASAGYVLLALALAVGTGVLAGGALRPAAALGVVALAAGGAVVARRERERPAEERLRAAERRWVP